MYNCHEIKKHNASYLTDEINSWFRLHPNAHLINISIVRDESDDYFHAFITWAEKEDNQ